LPELDETDIRVLRLLLENARLDYKTIAEEVGTSDKTVARRIKRMETLGVIEGYRAIVNREVFKRGLVRKPLTMLAEEVIETDSSEWDSLSDTISDVFGTGGFVVLLQIGSGIGRRYGERVKAAGLGVQEALLEFSRMIESRGWGRLEFEKLDFKRRCGDVVFSKNPFTTDSAPYIIRGLISGFTETVLGEKISVRKAETEGSAEEEPGKLRLTFEAVME